MGNLYWCYVIISVLLQCEQGAKLPRVLELNEGIPKKKFLLF